MPTPPDTRQHSATFFAYISTSSVTIDLTTHASGPVMATGAADKVLGRPCRAVIPHGAAGGTCTLAVSRCDGDDITISSCAYGVELPIIARKILPASDYTGLLVLW